MVSSKLYGAGMLAVGVLALTGCSSQASVRPKIAPGALPSAVQQPVRPARPVARDASLSVYSDPEYGVSFQYPRHYPLEEGAQQESQPGIRSQQDLDAEQPGAMLLATVVIPGDSYPNTTFVDGSVQLVAEPVLTSETCKDLLLARTSDWNGASGTAGVSNVVFAWRENITADGGLKNFERDYAGFSNEMCYEFLTRVTVGDAAEEEGTPKQANGEKILRQLEKIVSSLQVVRKTEE